MFTGNEKIYLNKIDFHICLKVYLVFFFAKLYYYYDTVYVYCILLHHISFYQPLSGRCRLARRLTSVRHRGGRLDDCRRHSQSVSQSVSRSVSRSVGQLVSQSAVGCPRSLTAGPGDHHQRRVCGAVPARRDGPSLPTRPVAADAAATGSHQRLGRPPPPSGSRQAPEPSGDGTPGAGAGRGYRSELRPN